MRLTHRLFVIVALMLSACAPIATPEPTHTATPTSIPTSTSTNTNTPNPTEPLQPTATPTPSGMVSVGEYALFYRCVGEGSPTVILESGFVEAGTSGSWSGVIQQIRFSTRICTYDRANLGSSDRTDGDRTSLDIAADLHTLLDNAGIDGPYILVGHSLGGWHVRVFAEQYPEEVAGLLLVDASHPDQLGALLPVLPAPTEGEARSITQARDQWSDPNSMMNNVEHFDFVASAEQVRNTGPYGALPLMVLTRDPDVETGTLPSAIHNEVERIWQVLQADLATLSEDSTHVIVDGAGHGIQHDKPQAVVDAILALIMASQEK